MIDTHCHLTFPEFRDRVPAVLADMRAAGVSGCITIATTTTDAMNALAIARAHEGVWCSAGVHPLYSDEGPHAWDHLRVCGLDARCVAWGELGLDNHYAEPARAVQRAVLDEQLAVLKALRDEHGLSKPLIIHCREAFDELIPVLAGSGLDPARMVFHCFTGTSEEARRVLDLGACLSFTGVATYRNARGVAEAVRLAPAGRLMVETDAPFLAPEPLRSVRPCRPAFARLTAEALAQIRGEPLAAFLEHVNDTTQRFFGLSVPREGPGGAWRAAPGGTRPTAAWAGVAHASGAGGGGEA